MELERRENLTDIQETTQSLQGTTAEILESPEQPDNDSARSESSSSSYGGGSPTSTIKYDQESYEVYVQRVEKLCAFLWPQPQSFKHRLSNSHAIKRLRANVIFRHFVPLPTIPTIERLEGGDYNRITGITLPSSHDQEDRKLILRVPRENHTRPDREVAILDFVRQRTSIPVPRIAAKDFSCENVLEKPFVLQHRIPGIDLSKVWKDLSHMQRCKIARDVGGVIRTLLSVESPVTGILETQSGESKIAHGPNVVPFELKECGGEIVEEPPQENYTEIGSPRPPQTTLDFFTTQFSRWRAATVLADDGEIYRDAEFYSSMLKAVQEMDALGLFKPDLHCLCHVDLYPRNIMVLKLEESIEITGILDWDEAVFGPKFVNCQPPRWLWDDQEFHLDEDGLLPWPYELEGANDLPPTPEKQEIKRIFEEYVGPEYSRLAYDEISRLGRGLFRIATIGLQGSEHFKAAERILKEWEVLRKSLAYNSYLEREREPN